MYVCMSETSKHVCMYVCLRQLSVYVCMSQTNIHTLSCLKHTCIHSQIFPLIQVFSVHGFVQKRSACHENETYIHAYFSQKFMFSGAFKHVCMFKIPLPVMENAQTSTQNTSKGCFSLNHVCMFEKSPKPLCLSCFLQFGLNAPQRTASIF